MSIRRVAVDKWTWIFPAGDRNSEVDIEAAADGLVIDYDTLPWDEIMQAYAYAQAMKSGSPADQGV